MEVTFEGSGTALTPHERFQFYQKMRQVVAIVDCYVAAPQNPHSNPEQEGNPDSDTEQDGYTNLGGGVTLERTGYLLTCAHIIEPNRQSVSFRLCDESVYWDAEVVKIDYSIDLAVIKIVKEEIIEELERDGKWRFAKICEEEDHHLGMEVYSILHSGEFFYTFAVGMIAFPCRVIDGDYVSDQAFSPWVRTRRCRFLGDIRFGQDQLEDYKEDLPLIQIQCLSGSSGGSGSPILNCNGEVIGIYVLHMRNYFFAVHNSFLKSFILEFVNPIKEPLKSDPLDEGNKDWLDGVTQYAHGKEELKPTTHSIKRKSPAHEQLAYRPYTH